MRFAQRALLVVLGAIAVPVASPSPALACSGAVDFKGLTEVLVVGRVLRVDIDRSVRSSGFVRAIVTAEVRWVLKGSAPGTIRFVDDRSVLDTPDPRSGAERVIFAGGSGACGTLDEDPTGKWIAIALFRDKDGHLAAHRLLGAGFGDSPTDPRVIGVLERHGFRLPSTSTAGGRADLAWPAWVRRLV